MLARSYACIYIHIIFYGILCQELCMYISYFILSYVIVDYVIFVCSVYDFIYIILCIIIISYYYIILFDFMFIICISLVKHINFNFVRFQWLSLDMCVLLAKNPVWGSSQVSAEDQVQVPFNNAAISVRCAAFTEADHGQFFFGPGPRGYVYFDLPSNINHSWWNASITFSWHFQCSANG